MLYKVVAEHFSNYPNPITVTKGDQVTVGEKYEGPEGWENWWYCSILTNGIEGWVPGQLLKVELGIGTVLEDYTAKELNVQMNDVVEGKETLNGWIWCVHLRSGDEGWLPLEKLEIRRVQSVESQFL